MEPVSNSPQNSHDWGEKELVDESNLRILPEILCELLTDSNAVNGGFLSCSFDSLEIRC